MNTMSFKNAQKMLKYYKKRYAEIEVDASEIEEASKCKTVEEIIACLEKSDSHIASFVKLTGLYGVCQKAEYASDKSIGIEVLATRADRNGNFTRYCKVYGTVWDGSMSNITQETAFALGYDFVLLQGKGCIDQWVLAFKDYRPDDIAHQLSELLYNDATKLRANNL